MSVLRQSVPVHCRSNRRWRSSQGARCRLWTRPRSSQPTKSVSPSYHCCSVSLRLEPICIFIITNHQHLHHLTNTYLNLIPFTVLLIVLYCIVLQCFKCCLSKQNFSLNNEIQLKNNLFRLKLTFRPRRRPSSERSV